jgi:hypothetical protein
MLPRRRRRSTTALRRSAFERRASLAPAVVEAAGVLRRTRLAEKSHTQSAVGASVLVSHLTPPPNPPCPPPPQPAATRRDHRGTHRRAVVHSRRGPAQRHRLRRRPGRVLGRGAVAGLRRAGGEGVAATAPGAGTGAAGVRGGDVRAPPGIETPAGEGGRG